MSIRVSTTVWEYSQQSGTKLLIMLALADQANDQGECWPSIATVAHKARLSERGVQYVIQQLIGSGELALKDNNRVNADGKPSGGRGHTTHYQITVQKPSPIASANTGKGAEDFTLSEKGEVDCTVSDARDAERVQDSTERVQSDAERVQTGAERVQSDVIKGARAVAPEPYLTVLTEPYEPNEPSRAGARGDFFLTTEDWAPDPGATGNCGGCGKALILSVDALCRRCHAAALARAKEAPPESEPMAQEQRSA